MSHVSYVVLVFIYLSFLGSVSRRLFARTQDFVLDKFYFLVSEKSSRLKSLLDELESVEDVSFCLFSFVNLLFYC